MSRGNGFVRFISMMLLALVLVIGVCGGVGAAAKSKTELQLLQEEVKVLKEELNDVRDRQKLSDGRAWYERAKLQLDHTKEWVGTEQRNIEQWYESLTHFTTIGGILVGLFGIGITFFSYNTARKQRIDAEKAKKDLDKEIEDFQKEAGTKKEALEAEQTAIADKQIKIQELLDKLEGKEQELNELIVSKSKEISDHADHCEEMAAKCDANLGKTDNAATEALEIVGKLNGEMKDSNEEEKKAVIKASENEPEKLFKSLKAKALAHELNKEWKQALQIWQTIEQEFPDNYENKFKIGYLYAEMYDQETTPQIKSEYFEKSSHSYQEATIEDPVNSAAWNNWALLLANRAKQTTGEEKVELWDKAEEKYKKATDIQPEYSKGWYNWANLLGDRAKQANGEDRLELWDEAEDKYQKTTDIKPEFSDAWCNWALLLANRAEHTTGEEKVELWDKAEEKFKKTTDIKPEDSEAWCKWALLLADRAKQTNEKEREELWDKAEEKYKKATDINPDYSEAWNNWAVLLANRAEHTTGEEKVGLWDKAEEKFKKATDFNPEYSEAWNNWAILLISKATVDPQNIDTNFLEQAKEKALRSENILEGNGAYNLACITSLQNNFDECKQWLIKSKEIGVNLPPCNHLKSDSDFDKLRTHPDYKDWFNDFVEQVCQEEQGKPDATDSE